MKYARWLGGKVEVEGEDPPPPPVEEIPLSEEESYALERERIALEKVALSMDRRMGREQFPGKRSRQLLGRTSVRSESTYDVLGR